MCRMSLYSTAKTGNHEKSVQKVCTSDKHQNSSIHHTHWISEGNPLAGVHRWDTKYTGEVSEGWHRLDYGWDYLGHHDQHRHTLDIF